MIARILIAAGALSLVVAGKAPIAKLLLALHLPSLASPLLDDPAIKGVALYRAGDYQAADLTFRAAGRGSTGPAASIWLPPNGSCVCAAASHSASFGRRAPAQAA